MKREVLEQGRETISVGVVVDGRPEPHEPDLDSVGYIGLIC